MYTGGGGRVLRIEWSCPLQQVTPLGFVVASHSVLCSTVMAHLAKAAFSEQVSSLEDLETATQILTS